MAKCNKCGDYVETAGDIRQCAGARSSGGCGDGTSGLVSGELAADTPIKTLIQAEPGLGNRFVPGSAPPSEVLAADEPAAVEAAAPASKPKAAKKKAAKRAKN